MDGNTYVATKATAMGVVSSTNDFMKVNFNDEVAKIVNQHAAGSVVAAIAAMFPGAGPTICMVAQTTLVYTMYVRMNRALNISLSKNVVKALASAVIANLVSNVGSMILGVVGATVLSFIPGIGNYASSLTMVALGYATVMIAALCYGKALLRMTKAGRNVEQMTEEEIKNAVKEEMDARDLQADVKAFSKAYKQGRKDGTFTGEETVTMED
ncbi:MAG: hypothetical protein E7316_10335 [Clostridiales bacterium]|nr:hypothetical protein [Clostridiales bacterium]